MVNKRKTSTGIQHREKAKRKHSTPQLTNLPTDILCSILSRLPFKEAVRTSVLSTQWKHLWCWYDKLDFSYDTIMLKSDWPRYFSARGRSINKRKFIKRVNATLRQHSGVGIQQFRVDYALLSEDADYIDTWVKYAIKSKAKELILNFSSTRFGPSIVPYDFPFQTLNMKNGMHMCSLHLSFVSLRPHADFTFFSDLTKLILEDVRVTDEDAQCLLTKCNQLGYLRIAYCKTLESLRTGHLNQLKHLHVENCPLLKVTESNCGLRELHYIGPIIPLVLPASPELTSICIKLSSCGKSVLGSVFSKLPDNLSALEMLTLSGLEFESLLFPRFLRFISLRHLILELGISYGQERHFDVLDIAGLLEAAPLMEKFDLHMVMKCHHRRYFEKDGELRSLPPCRYSHLHTVSISGFFGRKDQLELALHILRNAGGLKAMKILSRVNKLEPGEWHVGSAQQSADGYRVASEFVRKEDHNNVVEILEYMEA